MARSKSGGANPLATAGILTAVLGVSEEDMTKARILANLAALGGAVAQEDEFKFEGKTFVLPENFNGNLKGAAQYLLDVDEQLNTEHAFKRTFRYRPNDVAHALSEAMKKIFGTTGIGKETIGFFSVTPPTFITINTGPSTTAQIISGKTGFSPLSAVITVGAERDSEVGILGQIIVEAPRRYRAEVEGLFIAIEEELKTGSIYRGKAIDAAANPHFLDLERVNPERAIYTTEVMEQLTANVWSLLRHSEIMRGHGISLKRSILLYGPYGTGKSLAAALTAKEAVTNGWTFIQVRPGDDLAQAMQTAQLYAPAVVFFEDIDTLTENGDPDRVSKLLDMFDGIGAKGAEVMVIMTTNFIERIQKGMLRPGRMDAVIEIAAMDAAGFERLIKSSINAELLFNIDYAAVAEAFQGFLPAFAAEAVKRTITYAIARGEGEPSFLETSDFVGAAKGLRPQLELMTEAGEGTRTPTLDAVVTQTVQDAMTGVALANVGYENWRTNEDAIGYRVVTVDDDK